MIDLGLISYTDAYRKQQEMLCSVQETGETVIFRCEHPPVITFGRMTKTEHLLVSEEELNRKNIECVSIDRGGDITLHAPGQLVLYPIIDLKKYKQDLHWYLQTLEEITIRMLADFDLETHRIDGKTGVYIQNKKIVSMGIGVKKWITYHGVGINVSTDLDLFRLIKPCGLDVFMTSMEKELKTTVSLDKVQESWEKYFKEIFV